MLVELTPFVQPEYEHTDEFATVCRVAHVLLEHLNEPEILARIRKANQPGISSGDVQRTFAEYARQLGFIDESKGLFADYENRALRPDYYLRIAGSGILLEVERGKTTNNNMDLLDFWKCHICEHADYLFLLVPRELRQSKRRRAKVRREYEIVVKRLGSFFTKRRNYTNVRAVFVFGY